MFTDSAEENKGFKYCFVAIDIFTKYSHAVPIKDKKPPESVRAMIEVLDKIGIPEIFTMITMAHGIIAHSLSC